MSSGHYVCLRSRAPQLYNVSIICFIAHFNLSLKEHYQNAPICSSWKILWILMPYPCSHFYFDIKFGDRLYSKENRLGSPLLF